jgi:iron complex outermembrane recepter protein
MSVALREALMKRFGRTVLLSASALVSSAAMLPHIAYAQIEEAAADEEDAGLNGIVVTARKFEERLQNAPTTVAVATAETIENLNLTSVADISKTTAGLTFDDSFGRDANRPVIRGQANILGQSGVAFFIDGIYFTGSIADYDVNDIERIEVVKGPQSALYGRNTYSGAVNIISKMSSDQMRAKLSADISEHNRYLLTANLSGPVTDSISASVSGKYYDYGGEYTNLFDGEKVGKENSYSFSGALKFNNGGPLKAGLRTYYNKTDDGQPAIFATDSNANNCYRDNGALYRGNGRYFCGTIRPQVINTDYRRAFPEGTNVGIQSETFNASLRLDYDLSDTVTLTSLTGYNQRESTTRTDGDYGPNSFQSVIFANFPAGPGTRGLVNSPTDFTFENASKTKDWSQELRLTYDSDRTHIILGGYYFDQSDKGVDIRELPSNAVAIGTANAATAGAAVCARTPGCVRTFNSTAITFAQSRNTNDLDIRNIAAFGSIGYDLTDDFSISVEGRYSEERIRQAVVTRNSGNVFPTPLLAEKTFKKFTPRVTLDWQVTPNNLIYANYAEGQKPGGFNGANAIRAGVPVYDQENVKGFELGFKNSFLDNRLTANLAVFRNKITGYQLTQNVSVAGPPITQTSAIVNAGNARITGLEFELQARPSRNLTVTANYALANSKFTSGLDENQGVLNDVLDDGLVNCSTGDQFPAVSGCQSLFGSIIGKRIPRAPVHQIFADVDYHRDLGSGDWSIFTGANVTLLSSSFAQVHNLAETGGSVVVDARIGVENGNFKIQAYAKNLFDENSVAQIIRYASADNDLRRNFISGLRPGRRFGVVFTAKY